jgi:hypothetical protein
MNPANLDGIGRHGKTGIKQALVEAVTGPEQDLMPTRQDRISIPIGCRVMNAENSHNANIPSLDRPYLPGTPLANLLFTAGSRFRPLRDRLLGRLDFEQARKRATGNQKWGFGLSSISESEVNYGSGMVAV